jgi:orotate phosphoribosyltransferase
MNVGDPVKSQFRTSHYGISQKPDQLIPWAGDAVKKLHKIMIDGGYRIPIFCYRGMSGVSHATMIATQYYMEHGNSFAMFYCRKPNEKSNSSRKNEYSCGYSDIEGKFIVVFVDDFIDSGETVKIVVNKTREHLITHDGFVRDVYITIEEGCHSERENALVKINSYKDL